MTTGYEAYESAGELLRALSAPIRVAIVAELGAGERCVHELVEKLGAPQPLVSKHLRVLRAVGLVDVRDEGRQRLYRLHGQALKPIYDWVKTFERTWNERFDALDELLDELKRKEEGNAGSGE